MRRWLLLVIALCAIPLVGWAGYGTYVYSRNQLPSVSLPPAPSPPENNVYEQLVERTKQIQQSDLLAAMENDPAFGTLEQKQAVLDANQDVLEALSRLLDAPSHVTSLSPRVGDPYMESYRHVARLFVTEAKLHEAQGQYGKALERYIDGLAFAEQIMRGGNTLHLTFNFMSSLVIFEQVHRLLPNLAPADAMRGAQRLERLLSNEYPLYELVTQEFREQLRGWRRTVGGMAVRGFRLDLPQSQMEAAVLYRPKADAFQGAMNYAKAWIENSKLPYPQQTVVPYPSQLASLPEANNIARAPEDITLQIARYTYVRTRLRLLYTALRLEAHRKTYGRYPASLKQLGDSPYFIDPFANKPFIYRSSGSTYVLYSAGPNSADDGGAAFPESRLHRQQVGDIGLVPSFPRAP